MSNGDQQNDKPNYYELLCLEPGASKDDVRKAYRKQALLFHPDKMKPHMKEEASTHFQLISEAYEVLSDDEKRELYDRYGHEGVKAGGDPNPQPDLSGFFPPGGHGRSSHARPQGFGFGFDSPFFSSFGVPAGAGFNDQAFFADHHQRHMHNLFDHHMGSMFGGAGGFPRGSGHREPVFPTHDHGFHQQHHDAFFRSAFGNNDFFNQGQQQSQQQRPTLFSTSPFANSGQTQSQSQSQGQWSGTGSRTSPFTIFGSNGHGGQGGFSTSSSSSSSTMGSGASRTSTRTTIVNGKRTTVTEVTDPQGVTTTTVEKPDGTREIFVNGVATGIEGRAQPASLEQGTARQQPIVILDDDDVVGQRDRRTSSRDSGDRERDRGRDRSSSSGRTSGDGGYRLGINRTDGVESSSTSARRASGDRDPYRRTAATGEEAHPGRGETVFLDDDDDDDIMYETLSEQRRTQQGGRGPVGAGGGASTRLFDDDADLFHPHMGNGQRLGGSNSPERSRYGRN
ncbi:MAG: hypothetical protein J3R72DRAFT_525605 [Linnemannia gamsii]|nr:MAG: hypothetical protein J3R72DRAFT_525605 [Linnemannia gamsii]